MMKPMMKAMTKALVLGLVCAAAAWGQAPTFVHEGVIDAPVAEVWKVFSTSEGYKALGVALADVDFRVGGTIRSRYRADGVLGDDETIENQIMAYEPLRMVAFPCSSLIGQSGEWPFTRRCECCGLELDALCSKMEQRRVVDLRTGVVLRSNENCHLRTISDCVYEAHSLTMQATDMSERPPANPLAKR